MNKLVFFSILLCMLAIMGFLIGIIFSVFSPMFLFIEISVRFACILIFSFSGLCLISSIALVIIYYVKS